MRSERQPLFDGESETIPTRWPRSERGPGQPNTLVSVEQAVFGGKRIVVIGGPCAVEDRLGLNLTAAAVAAAGATMLRGGVFKPRTSPYSFQGLGQPGLELLEEARLKTRLPFVTEVLDPRDVELVATSADMLQIGSRSIQNFPLLKEAGRSGRPILLKRGMMTTVDEWLSSVEHLLAAGAEQVVLCERGIRTFESTTRNTLDLGSVAVMKQRTHLPVIVDSSHAAGNATYVSALSRAAVAVGADGLLVEVHHQPERALSDGYQSLTHGQFQELVVTCRAVARAVGRDL